MKLSRFWALAAVVFVCASDCIHPQKCSAAPATDASPADKHTKPILDALKLTDAAKETKVREIVGAQIKALDAWHTQNDVQITVLWDQFNGARSKQDEAGANKALAEINGVYASFKPQHEIFLSELSTVLTPEQVESVKDTLTVKKVEVTFHAYGEIFHGLTDAQKAFILKHLKAAREEAIDAGTMTEKSAFFKKYKIQIEAYLTAQGYDVKESYRVFVAKQKADEAAKKAAAGPAAEDKK